MKIYPQEKYSICIPIENNLVRYAVRYFNRRKDTHSASLDQKCLIGRPGSPLSLCIWVFAVLMMFFCSTAAHPAPSEVQQLAAEAKQRFSRVMQPPIPENRLPMHALFLEPSALHRDYVVKSFDEAIDALVAEADRQERVPAVANALRDLIKRGDTEAVDQVFAEMLERALADNKTPNPQVAAALRHSVALVELPVALQPTTFPRSRPIDVSPFVSLTLNGEAYSSRSGIKPMPGRKTLPAYLRAAGIDPGHLWTWIVIANLAQRPQDFEDALTKAEKIARTNDDRHALVLVKLELGRLRNKFKLPAQASEAYRDAVSTASKGLAEHPADDTWKQDLATALMGLGVQGFDVKEKAWMTGPQNVKLMPLDVYSPDAKQSVTSLDKTVDLWSQLSAGHPENSRLRLELAIAHYRLATAYWYYFSDKDGKNAESEKHFAEARRIYNTLTASEKWKPTIQLSTGVFASGLLRAGGLTLAMGLGVIFLYRRRMTRWMREASSAKTVSDTGSGQTVGQTPDQSREIEFTSLTPRTRPQGASFASTQMTSAHKHFRRATWIYVLGGAAFALIAAILTIILDKTEISYIGLLGNSLIYGWPVVLTLWLLWGPDRKRLIVALFVYFGILLAISVRFVLADTAPLKLFGIMIPAFYQPLIKWLLFASHSLFLLLFLNRHIRAVGPVLLVFMMTLMAGSTLILFIESSRGGSYLFLGFPHWLQRVAGVSDTLFWLPQIVGVLLVAPIGGWLVRGLCRGYEKKQYSELTLIIDSIWLFDTGFLCIWLSHYEGHGYWLVLTAFAAYKIITYLGLRHLARDASHTAPARLLLLRVFGFKRRSERLFKLLEARWRYAGPIQLIAAPDLASSTAGPADFLSFITGKLRHRFIIEPADIERRLTNMDYNPDPDGRYRVNEVFCGNDAWRPVVQYLMTGNDLVVMDLRSFSAKNQGCLFELQALVDYVPFDRMVLLVDDGTDTGLLSQTLTARWQQTNSTSPNIQGTGRISVLHVSWWDETTIDTLLEIADERLCNADEAL